jgi:hypothetical protein
VDSVHRQDISIYENWLIIYHSAYICSQCLYVSFVYTINNNNLNDFIKSVVSSIPDCNHVNENYYINLLSLSRSQGMLVLVFLFFIFSCVKFIRNLKKKKLKKRERERRRRKNSPVTHSVSFFNQFKALKRACCVYMPL